MPENTISGPGYTAQLPEGFTIMQHIPAYGAYWLMPPGVTMVSIDALLQIRPVAPAELPALLQNLGAFETPMVAQMNANNLGLAQVLGILPLRTVPMPQGLSYLREFDAINFRGFPVRVMVLVIGGPQSTVEVVIVMSLMRWAEFTGPCLELVGQVQLQGAAAPPVQVQAVVDPAHTNQVQYQLATPGHAPIPLTAMPAVVNGTVIVHMETIVNNDNSIRARDIGGTGVVVGQHSTATVNPAV